MYLHKCVLYSRACGIEDTEDDSFITTGGYVSSTLNRVTKYYRNGTYVDMPRLNTARRHHACGCFMNTNQQKVDKVLLDEYLYVNVLLFIMPIFRFIWWQQDMALVVLDQQKNLLGKYS